MGNDSPAPNNLLEAVPNFSEGRSQPTLRRLVEAAGPPLLDLHADASHHRSVLTLAGSASQLRSSARSLFETAVHRIDLRRHRGEHPRIGALDVLPIVPLGETTMERAVLLAVSLAEEIGAEQSVPVFLYGEAEPGGRTLPQIRRGGLRGLADRLARGEIRSDHGPPTLHPSAGGHRHRCEAAAHRLQRQPRHGRRGNRAGHRRTDQDERGRSSRAQGSRSATGRSREPPGPRSGLDEPAGLAPDLPG